MNLRLALPFLAAGVLLAPSAAAGLRVVPPGREGEVRSLVESALSAAGVGAAFSVAPFSVAIDRADLRVSVCPGSDRCRVFTVPPDGPVTVDGGDLPPGLSSLAAALARERDLRHARIWQAEAEDAGPERPAAALRELWPEGNPTPAGEWVTRALLALLLAHAALRLLRLPVRELALPAAVAAAFVLFAILLARFEPAHDHLSFVARSDCARTPGCDEDVHGAWLPPAFHVHRLLLALVPSTAAGAGAGGLALSVAVLLLLHALVRGSYAAFGLDREGRAAALAAVLVLASHPVFARVAVAGTFWPFSIAAFLAASLAALRAVRTADLADSLAAAGWLALACLGNLVFLALLPLAVLVPLVWRSLSDVPRRKAALSWLAALALLAVLAGPTFVSAFDRLFVSATEPFEAGAKLGPVDAVLRLVFLDTRLTSPGVAALFLAGLLVFAFAPRARPLAPLLLAFGISELFLGTMNPLDEGYPTRLVHGFPSLAFSAAVAGAAAAWLLHRAPERRRRLAAAGIAAACVLPSAVAEAGWTFLVEERVLPRELRAIEDAVRDLPDHDLLVVPPPVLPVLGGVERASDPVEAWFPVAAYREGMSARGGYAAPVVPLDAFLEASPPPRTEGTLVYVGSTLRTFLRSEKEAGVVPASLERPELTELRRRYTLEPVRTFLVPTAQNPLVDARLAADRLPEVELGFYRLR